MHKIYVDSESWHALEEWSKQYPNLSFTNRAFFKKCELHLKHSEMIAYIDHKQDRIKINCKSDGICLFKLTVIPTDNNYKNPKVKASIFDVKEEDLPEKEINTVIGIIVDGYLLANSYLFFGNILESKQCVATGRNDGKDKVIVFRKYKDGFYAVKAGYHRSPTGVFSVRGHLRKYKDGKVIWIDSYMKGVEKE